MLSLFTAAPALRLAPPVMQVREQVREQVAFDGVNQIDTSEFRGVVEPTMAPNRFNPAEEWEFRHGSDRTSIGFQGGTGSGLGNDVSQGFKTGLATPADAFRHGSDCTSIGFQGGIGSGLGEQGSQVIAPTWANPEDEFRFGVNSKAIDCKGGL